ncbi:uncharacterized protein LOC8284931 [Ricinus communis]|uniref:uncharacterized protein LOC8284931 n=1 Tax=Ricinus communis TaxID=3988 RepID=UPI0007727B65|nr:uncharacterized protein LOC8284931 [Ricinus communis]|eukprot:XP_015584153.1 uncharacterized protein LOC8284931 [Ricinus communis]
MGPSLCNLVIDVFNGGSIDLEINCTNTFLIPKMDAPESSNHFRPIILCNVTYKLITKVIANHLKIIMSKVISPMQSSIVKGRHIMNNIIIVKEILHLTNKMTSKTGYMVIKVDLEKAYDKLNWSFILDTLMDRSIPSGLINVIMNYITSASMQIS